MYITQPFAGIHQLIISCNFEGSRSDIFMLILTNLRRFVVGFDITYSLMFPCAIHSITEHKGERVVEMPRKRTMFGCDRRFQILICLENVYDSYIE